MKKIFKEEAILKLEIHNPNIILIDEYAGYNKKTKFKCNKCDNIINNSFYNLLNSKRKNGCIKCEKRKPNKKPRSRSKTHKQFMLDVSNIWGDLISVIGEYNNGSEKITVKCNVCNEIWRPEAKSLLAKHGCPKCGHKKNRESTVKKHEEYIDEVNLVHKKRIEVIGQYISNKDKILLKCNVCQNEWNGIARNILKGRGCPKCKLNKGETLINELLEKLDIDFKFQYTVENLKTEDNGTPIFDFAIFENDKLNTIIEFDGIQHFKPIDNWGGYERFLRQQKIDEFKNKYCANNNIRMIRIKYSELNKINLEYIKEKLVQFK